MIFPCYYYDFVDIYKIYAITKYAVIKWNIINILFYICFQFLAVLNFFATGCYQRRTLATSQMSQAVVCRLINKFSTFIADKLSGKYIDFPVTLQEKQQKAER